jgi:hypothetical protein
VEDETLHDGGETIEALSTSNLGSFALARLERFAARLADPRLQEFPAWQRLARHAVAAGLADCVALELAAEALVILNAARRDLPRRA